MEKIHDDVLPRFCLFRRHFEGEKIVSKKKMRLFTEIGKTFEEGVAEYILDCKARNLRNGTIIHYQEAVTLLFETKMLL